MNKASPRLPKQPSENPVAVSPIIITTHSSNENPKKRVSVHPQMKNQLQLWGVYSIMAIVWLVLLEVPSSTDTALAGLGLMRVVAAAIHCVPLLLLALLLAPYVVTSSNRTMRLCCHVVFTINSGLIIVGQAMYLYSRSAQIRVPPMILLAVVASNLKVNRNTTNPTVSRIANFVVMGAVAVVFLVYSSLETFDSSQGAAPVAVRYLAPLIVWEVCVPLAIVLPLMYLQAFEPQSGECERLQQQRAGTKAALTLAIQKVTKMLSEGPSKLSGDLSKVETYLVSELAEVTALREKQLVGSDHSCEDDLGEPVGSSEAVVDTVQEAVITLEAFLAVVRTHRHNRAQARSMAGILSGTDILSISGDENQRGWVHSASSMPTLESADEESDKNTDDGFTSPTPMKGNPLVVKRNTSRNGKANTSVNAGQSRNLEQLEWSETDSDFVSSSTSLPPPLSGGKVQGAAAQAPEQKVTQECTSPAHSSLSSIDSGISASTGISFSPPQYSNFSPDHPERRISMVLIKVQLLDGVSGSVDRLGNCLAHVHAVVSSQCDKMGGHCVPLHGDGFLISFNTATRCSLPALRGAHFIGKVQRAFVNIEVLSRSVSFNAALCSGMATVMMAPSGTSPCFVHAPWRPQMESLMQHMARLGLSGVTLTDEAVFDECKTQVELRLVDKFVADKSPVSNTSEYEFRSTVLSPAGARDEMMGSDYQLLSAPPPFLVYELVTALPSPDHESSEAYEEWMYTVARNEESMQSNCERQVGGSCSGDRMNLSVSNVVSIAARLALNERKYAVALGMLSSVESQGNANNGSRLLVRQLMGYCQAFQGEE